jgi:hypothetical protein
MPAVQLVDSLGTPLAVGQTVKLVGTITALYPFDNTYNEVVITLSHPVPGVFDVTDTVGTTGPDATVHGPGPGAVKTISVPALMLVVGA